MNRKNRQSNKYDEVLKLMADYVKAQRRAEAKRKRGGFRKWFMRLMRVKKWKDGM